MAPRAQTLTDTDKQTTTTTSSFVIRDGTRSSSFGPDSSSGSSLVHVRVGVELVRWGRKRPTLGVKCCLFQSHSLAPALAGAHSQADDIETGYWLRSRWPAIWLMSAGTWLLLILALFSHKRSSGVLKRVSQSDFLTKMMIILHGVVVVCASKPLVGRANPPAASDCLAICRASKAAGRASRPRGSQQVGPGSEPAHTEVRPLAHALNINDYILFWLQRAPFPLRAAICCRRP